jgi:guanyl-specific ribonuclease Sa
MKPTE